jgi:hypothetical protein
MEPRTLDEYLRKTEHAVRHFYAGLDSCWRYYREALTHWDISKVGEPMTPKRCAELQKYLALAGRYFDLKFSEATFAGSILQVAAIAIRRFSSNAIIPESCMALVPANAKGAMPFCVGRQVHGVPAGLIVYAARNQYNHWDDEPQKATRRIFDALCAAFQNDPFYDLAFDMGNPTITIHANEVLLGALCWRTYEQYEAEIRGMLTYRDNG